MKIADALSLQVAVVAVPVLGAFVLAFTAARRPDSSMNRALARHTESLRQQFAELFVFVDPTPIVAGQAVASYLFGALAVVHRELRMVLAIPLVLILPSLVLSHLRRRRRARLEDQVDGFVLGLSSALHATPNIADAFRSMLGVVSEPLKSEIDLTLKQMRLGATFEQALLLMGRRVGSRAFDTALTTVLIGQRLGGQVPTTLAATGEALRELNRLHRTSRARLASGRVQLRLIACAPIAVSIAAERLQPGYFEPFRTHAWGAVAVGVAIAAWFAALVIGRRLLAIQI